MRIDARGMHYNRLNELIRQAAASGETDIILDNICGQRYIGDGLSGDARITINGVPGNDLGAFMNGPTLLINSNGQDGIGNTMNSGKIIVQGDVGDIAGFFMRGGRIYIKGDAGYRIGIHMKSYKDLFPVIVIGGTAGDFLGEYMAGGLIIVLGLGEKERPVVGDYCGTGMHGGVIYIRGEVEDYLLGGEIKKNHSDSIDDKILREYLKEYCVFFSLDLEEIMKGDFMKVTPFSHRPYGKLYAY